MTKSGLIKGALMALVVGAATAATSTPASAYVVCNRWHECWRTHERYEYAPGLRLGIIVHSDRWWRMHHRHPGYYWRGERHDRGYWRHGRWHTW